MSTDFLDAHVRHWEDGELLWEKKRWANADHLYGLAAECGLKQLMHAFGMKLDDKGDPIDNKDKCHLDKLWKRYETYCCGHIQSEKYLLSSAKKFFVDWNVEQRYSGRSFFSQSKVEPHKEGASQVHNLIEKARHDGLFQRIQTS